MKSLRRRVVSRLLVFGLVLALLLGVAYTGMIENHFIYFPLRELEAEPSSLGLPFDEVYFVTQDGVRLHGWFAPGESGLTWLWCHGNAGNISHRLENLALLHQKLGVSVFLFDYRGYGRSEGRPSEKGTYLDAEAALAYLHSREDIDNSRIIYFGRSLGAAVAVELATRQPPAALILESPFPSVPYMARRLYPFLPVWPLLRTKYDSLSKMAQIDVPLLVLHGDNDDIVPLEAGRKLFEAAGGDKSFYTIHSAGHNDTYLVGGQAYFDALYTFIQRLK
ncbi:MAG: alpha/beta hydrolase [Chloroflexi bacterium]|nr:alpha/beta hydrolase [Chloroflexota bacterium]